MGDAKLCPTNFSCRPRRQGAEPRFQHPCPGDNASQEGEGAQGARVLPAPNYPGMFPEPGGGGWGGRGHPAREPSAAAPAERGAWPAEGARAPARGLGRGGRGRRGACPPGPGPRRRRRPPGLRPPPPAPPGAQAAPSTRAAHRAHGATFTSRGSVLLFSRVAVVSFRSGAKSENLRWSPSSEQNPGCWGCWG